MAKYMLLIFGETEQWNAMTPAQTEAHMAAHGTFAATAGSALVDGAQLEAESTATTLRSDGSGATFSRFGRGPIEGLALSVRISVTRNTVISSR